MISISTITGSNTGNVMIHEMPNSVIEKATARISRNATLDGGTEFVHSGVSDGDRTLLIVANKLTESEVENLRSIFEDGQMVIVSTVIGCFNAAISSLQTDAGNIKMTIMVKEKLSA